MSRVSPQADRQWILDVNQLWKSYGHGEARIQALAGVDLKVAMGEFVAVMGPSGSGKSTLLNLLGGVELPDSGQIEFDGVDLTALNDEQRTLLRRRKIGFVFQRINLLPNLTAIENVALPLLLDKTPRSEAFHRAAQTLEAVNMQHREKCWPGTLSGGEQQRVAIARAVVIRPVMILADEPTGALDSVNSQQVMRLLSALADEQAIALIVVTHDLQVAAKAGRIARVHDGRLVSNETIPQPPRARIREDSTR
jgi:putative ABC transport system ATP-binding protein